MSGGETTAASNELVAEHALAYITASLGYAQCANGQPCPASQEAIDRAVAYNASHPDEATNTLNLGEDFGDYRGAIQYSGCTGVSACIGQAFLDLNKS